MEREPTIEELVNKISLLEKTLEFYSFKTNYPDMINKDMGTQARFALEQIKNISSFEEDMISKLKSALSDRGKDIDSEEVNNVINKIGEINKIFDKL